MKKHAASHGLAVLVCTVSAGLLVKMGHEYYPQIAQQFEKAAQFLVSKFELPYSPEIVSVTILAIFLAAIWGMAFSFMHSDKEEE